MLRDFINSRFPKRPDGKRSVHNHQIEFLGWILFTVSAVGFVIASIGNFWAMFGSVFFLIACLVFMLPFFRGR